MVIAVLAVQGAFIEHEKVLKEIGAEVFELRKKEDLDRPFDGLVLPGGESTVQQKLLKELGMFDILKKKIQDGLPVFATCAGLILLAEKLSNDDRKGFQTLPVTVKRNAYGRQLGSFHRDGIVRGIAQDETLFPMEFIQAPYIEEVRGDTEVLAKVDDHIVAVRNKNQLAMAFHPELSGDDRLHRAFLQIIQERNA
ncbi:MAG: pyridoxal 5'-phosphate synthase glutaminase subunit PdxT [Eubacterium sp.]|nr:pyridoxal 5'-phosphate synthase glutaminase subunit PdxT [Eubacterium sp.]